MALNLSQIVTRLKMRLGIYGIHLPIENVDGFIQETIELFTIPTFSIYQPYYDHLHVNVSELQKNDNFTNGLDNREAYLLPEFKNRKLITVADVKYDDMAGGFSGFGVNAYAGLMGGNQYNLMQQMMLTNVTSQIHSQLYPRLTFDFIAPMTLVLYNLINSNRIDITLAFEHHKSLATIPTTCDKSFTDLALYDCQINFYQIAKHWDNIETALGNINLKIEDWADAESKRTTMLEEWDNTYHMDIPDSIIYK